MLATTLESINVIPTILRKSRKTQQPIGGTQLRKIPGVSFTLGLLPHQPEYIASSPIMYSPPSVAESDIFELDVNVVNISSEAFARRVIFLKKLTSDHSRSASFSNGSDGSSGRTSPFISIDDEYEILAEANAMNLNTRTMNSFLRPLPKSKSPKIKRSTSASPRIRKLKRNKPSPNYYNDNDEFVDQNVSNEFIGTGSNNTHRDLVEKIIGDADVGLPYPHRVSPGSSCQFCSSKKTGQWRRGPEGARTLCNGCGLAFSKCMRKLGRSY
jgi:hypothetical protein